MPANGGEYALLQKKIPIGNIQKTVASYRERARERERYVKASERNSLEQQRANILNSLDRPPCANATILSWATYESQ